MVTLLRALLRALLLSLLTIPAMANDGVLEINQTCAVETGCFPGDSPGFPITITTSGSFLLTSNLSVGDPNVDGIVLSTTATLDLGGFELSGSAFGGSNDVGRGITGTGPTEGSFASASTIRNGIVRAFKNRGIALSGATGIRVQEVTLESNLGGGIDAGQHAQLIANVVRNSGNFGIQLQTNSLMRDNVVFGTTPGQNGGGDVVYLSGARDTGLNSCEDLSCRVRPAARRYYLSVTQVAGNGPPSACAPGFHFASYRELREPSSYEYDAELGATLNGSVPPALTGWIRGAGGSACSDWSSSSGALTGTVGLLTSVTGGSEILWENAVVPCSVTDRVWCLED